jgi:predicted RNA-binding protein with PUA-like domain
MQSDKKTFWDGVRNYQARNFLKEMKKGDKALFYHSGKDKAVVGEVEVAKEYYQDPSTDDSAWVAVDVKFVRLLKKPVTLADIKSTPSLSKMFLVTHSRLSVMAITENEYDTIIKMSNS